MSKAGQREQRDGTEFNDGQRLVKEQSKESQKPVRGVPKALKKDGRQMRKR